MHAWLCLYRFQHVYVVDDSIVIIATLKDNGTSMGKVYELGERHIFTVHELVTSFAPVNFKLFGSGTCDPH